MKRIKLTLVLALSLIVLSSTQVRAQSTWSQCPGGEPIVRCETYDCPQGDTNHDGACTLQDSGAKYADAKNNSLCANPLSGCGEVRYFAKDETQACAIRVKENENNCSLYNAGKPNFSSPSPSPTASPKPTKTPIATVAGTTTKGGESTNSAEKLPETGPSFAQTLFLVSMGFLGIYIYNKYRFA
jgi:hypothetical protein